MNDPKLKETAESVFKRYPRVDKVFVTSDGQAFFDESNARNHAIPNKRHKELKVETFHREDPEKKETDPEKKEPEGGSNGGGNKGPAEPKKEDPKKTES